MVITKSKKVVKSPQKTKSPATLKIEASCDADQLSQAVGSCKKMKCCTPKPNCIYILGIIGAAIYFIGNAVGFRGGVVAFLKAIVWPIFLVKGLLVHIGM